MRWAEGEWRWITVALVLLAAAAMLWRARARRLALARFGDPALVRALRDGQPTALRAGRSVLTVLALALVGLAAARPQGLARTDVVSRRGIDIVVCLDVSKSMLARDVRPSRIQRARNELRRLMEEEPGDRIGVVVFAGATMEYPLTTDHQSAERFFEDVEPWSFPVGGTSIGRAITAAAELFHRDPLASRRSKVIIVITDGEDLEGEPVDAARAAAEAGAQVFIDAIGTAVPEPIPQFTPDGHAAGFARNSNGEIAMTSFTPEMQRQLEATARAGNGRFFHAHAGEVGIEAVRREIAGLRRQEIAATQQTVFDERMVWFVLPAFVLLVVASTLVPERIVPRPVRPVGIVPPPRAAARRRRAKPRPEGAPAR